MNSHQLGILLACIENGVDPRDFSRIEGMAKAASQNPGPVGRMIAKAAYDVMATCGRAHTAPANHLLMISKQASWCPQFQDVVDEVQRTLFVLLPLEKRAFQVSGGDVLGALGSVGKGIGYGSLLAGGGLGALYWLLNRHSTQDESDIEAMKQQADYYQQLTRELEHNLRRKYNYNPSQNPNEAEQAEQAPQGL